MAGPDGGFAAHQRLLAYARANQEDASQCLRRFVSERALAAIGRSPHRERFAVHGAWSLGALLRSNPRDTRDIDLIDVAPSMTVEPIPDLASAITQPDCEPVHFEWSRARVSSFMDRPRPLHRVVLEARLGPARLPVRINVMQVRPPLPATEVLFLPRALLGLPRPWVSCCTAEEVVAMKAALLVTYGPDHTRLKDLLDIAVLADHLPFSGESLLAAMSRTFQGRDADRMLRGRDWYWEAGFDPRRITGSMQAAWERVADTTRLAVRPGRLRDVVLCAAELLVPVLMALRDGLAAPETWSPDCGWSRRDLPDHQPQSQGWLGFVHAHWPDAQPRAAHPRRVPASVAPVACRRLAP